MIPAEERPPLSLYVHLPWCVRKCPYCDFNSHRAGSAPPLARYVDALIADARVESARVESARAGGRALISIFLGGGTPSLFPAAQIDRLLVALGGEFEMAADVEITMEVNPGAIEHDDLSGYRAAGVNRLSIGAQSFSGEALRSLGRIHDTEDTARAVGAARAAGITNLNLDLMYGLPGQDLVSARRDLEQAVALGPEHLSWYELTLEPNTVFHARPPAGLPDEALIETIRETGQAFLAASDYRQYEVSAYARGGRRCRHNLNYWLFGDYLAIGAGAHGKLTNGHEIVRTVRPANPLAYMEFIERGGIVRGVPVPSGDRLFEFMLNALRLDEGFGEALAVRRAGVEREALRERLGELREKGLVEEPRPGFWRASMLGRRFLNDVQGAFLP